MSKPLVKIAVSKLKYQALSDYAANIVASMTAAIANFPTPIPTLASLTALNALLIADIAAWGPVGNRGSHADLLTLRNDANNVYNSLRSLAAYVQNLTDPSTSYADQAAFIATSGFGVKNASSPQGPLAVVQNFHQLIQPKISVYTPKLKWKKPIGVTSPGNVKAYQIFRGDTLTFSNATLIGNSTKTSFTDLTPVRGVAHNYWVVPVNSAGLGVVSAPITITIPD